MVVSALKGSSLLNPVHYKAPCFSDARDKYWVTEKVYPLQDYQPYEYLPSRDIHSAVPMWH